MKTSPGGAVVKLVVVLAVLFACAATAWMVFLPRVVARYIRERTGFDVKIETLYCNPLTADLSVRGLVITNPPAFPQKDFVSLREFRVDVRWASLFGRRLEVNDATVNIAEITIVRDQQGRVNARLFQQALAGPAGSPAPVDAKNAGTRKERPFLIRHLTVRMDRLRMADYSSPKPETREYNLNFSHTYDNVTSAQQLAAPLAEALGNVAGALAGVMPGSSGLLRDAGNTLKDAGSRTGAALKGLFDSLEKRFQK